MTAAATTLEPVANPSPSPAPRPSPPTNDPVAVGRQLLSHHGRTDPVARYELARRPDGGSRNVLLDATATALMELYRDERTEEAFGALVAVAGPALTSRVRTRLRCLASSLDPDEVLQDVFINVYRYPDRFDGARAGAFRAWSSVIVDNAIRRQLRNHSRGPDVQVRSHDHLCREADAASRNPLRRVATTEDCANACRALQVFLCYYLDAFQRLGDRERFVLQMVEVRGMRYAPLAEILEIRPEALKMVVFRARRRILDHVRRSLGLDENGVPVATRA